MKNKNYMPKGRSIREKMTEEEIEAFRKKQPKMLLNSGFFKNLSKKKDVVMH